MSRSWFAITLCAWTLLVWTTRIGNIWGDADLTDGEKWGRTGLALSFTVLAVVAAYAVLRARPWRGLAVRALAGWTTIVWLARSFGIATGDHDAAFVVVHLFLALVSIVLSVLAVREHARATDLGPVSACGSEPSASSSSSTSTSTSRSPSTHRYRRPVRRPRRIDRA